MNFHFLWHDVLHSLFHFENGILFTAIQLFTRPGNAIREFIDGKRVKYVKPISFLLLLATIHALLYHAFHVNLSNLITTREGKMGFNIANDLVTKHYSLVTLISLPLYALGSFLAFKKQGYNFVEHLVLNAFLAGQRLIVHILILPLVYLCSSNITTTKIILEILALTDIILLLWGYSQFFNRIPKIKSFLLTILAYTIYYVSFLLIASIYAIIVLTSQNIR